MPINLAHQPSQSLRCGEQQLVHRGRCRLTVMQKEKVEASRTDDSMQADYGSVWINRTKSRANNAKVDFEHRVGRLFPDCRFEMGHPPLKVGQKGVRAMDRGHFHFRATRLRTIQDTGK